MIIAILKGTIKELDKYKNSNIFREYREYDEENSPNPICSTCRWILSEYKA